MFFVPLGTLLSSEASRLGITGADDLYGGVVPYAFMRTRAISHGLVGRHASRPSGWSDTFSAAVASSVLPGLTAFTRDDARLGSQRLLERERGPVRLKPPGAAGARQQRVVRSLAEVDEALASVSEAELAEYGLVLEPELRHVLTLSVGRVSVDHRRVSHIGVQRQTRDNDGRVVYGGSDLTVVPGDWDALDRLDVGPGTRQAVVMR